MMSTMFSVKRSIPFLAVLLATSACASLNKKENGAVIGASTGAVIGGVIGRANGSTTKGAIIGAAVGGTAGAVIGHQMDQQAKEIEQGVPGAVVERVGEGMNVTFASGLLFGFDSSVLGENAKQNLSTFAANLGKYPNTNILIVGYTDSQGKPDYNLSLSARRAAAARDYLVSQGVSAARLQTAGRGETEPVATNDTDAGRQANRRVEVAIFASDSLKANAARSGM